MSEQQSGGDTHRSDGTRSSRTDRRWLRFAVQRMLSRYHDAENIRNKWYTERDKHIAQLTQSSRDIPRTSAEVSWSLSATSSDIVSDQRWAVGEATMHAVVAIACQNEMIVAQNNEIIDLLTEISRKLNK